MHGFCLIFCFSLVWFGLVLVLICVEMTQMSQGFHRHLYLSDWTLFAKVMDHSECKSMVFALYLVLVWFGLVLVFVVENDPDVPRIS